MLQKPRRRPGVKIALAVAALACPALSVGRAAAQAAATTAPAQSDDCANPRYLALVGTPFATMGNQEFGEFQRMDEKCRAQERAKVIAAAACAHKPYADLLTAKKPADMNKREYDYFVVVDRECAAQAAATPPPQPSRQPTGFRQLLTGAAVLGAIIATAIAGAN
jgi:hypothetical protein